MFKPKGILILLLLCAGSTRAVIVCQDSFESNSGALTGRLPDLGTAAWQNTDGSFQVTNGVLETTTNGLTSAWLAMPSISTGDIIRISAVIVGNGDVNTDYISFGLVNAKVATYSSGAPWLSLLRRVDNDRGYLRGHSGPGSSGTNLLNSANLTETQGFTTTLNARNTVTMQYDTASGQLSVWMASEGGTTVIQYDGPVYYGGVAEAIVPMDAIKYLAVSFNRVDPLGASNPAYLDDLTVEIIPDGGDSTQIENNEPGRWTFQDCIEVQSNTLLQTVTNGASAQTWFFGTGVEVYVKEDAFTGYAQIYVDDRYMGKFNTYSATDQSSVQVFSISGLRRTDHRFKIVQKGASGVKLDFIKAYDDPTVELDSPDVQAASVAYDSPDVSTFSELTVLQTNTAPHIFHFRRSEADALKLSPDFAQWEDRYDRLMGIVGKMYNEDEIHLAGTNYDFPQRAFFRAFKTNHPEQLALLHFDGQLRNIASRYTKCYPDNRTGL
jgi:hypothetical protein